MMRWIRDQLRGAVGLDGEQERAEKEQRAKLMKQLDHIRDIRVEKAMESTALMQSVLKSMEERNA